MTLARGVAGAGAAVPPTAPTSVTITRVVVDNGTAPKFTVSWTGGAVSPKSNFSATRYNYNFSYGATSQSMAQPSSGFTSGSEVTLTTSATGVLCKTNISIFDARNLSATSAYSSEVRGLTRPANVGTVTANAGTNTFSASWSAVNAGGDNAAVVYYWSVFNSSNVLYSSGSTTGNSMSLSSVPAGSYYIKVYAQNTLAKQLGADSQSGTVTVVSPPFFPFFPSFGPFFPFFPSFGPFFGPSFPRFMY